MKKKNSFKKTIFITLASIMVISIFTMVGYAALERWQGVANGDILVKDTVTKIADGVVEHELITNNDSGTDQRIDYLCEVKPSDSIKVVAGYGNMDGTKWSLTRTTDQAKAYEKKNPGETVVAGINADFFNMANGEPMGALVMDGKKYHEANGRWYFGITKDNKPIVSNNSDLSNLRMAVGGDQVLVKDGKPVEESDEYGSIRYSRTAVGIKEDGTIVTFATYGHKPPVSNGRTYKEIGEMFAKEGCITALALDGGGSSTYAGRPEGTDKLLVRNTPGDGAERAVSSSILVVSTKEKTGVFDHAQLSPNNKLYTPNSTVKMTAKGVDTAGFPMELPGDVKFTLAEQSKGLGSIDEKSGEFKANDKTGEVTVNLEKNGKIVGETTIEIAVPDKIQFATEEISLGFEEKTDLGIKLKNKERELHFNVGDIKWNSDNDKLGHFEGNEFISSDGESVEGNITATSAYNEKINASIKVIVGKLPVVVWNFEDKKNESGEVIETAEDYYIGNEGKKGILNHSNYNRGGKESIEIAQLQNDDPVRFGAKSLKVNYDFRECGEVTEGACVGTTEKFEVPGTPTAIGAWVYAPEGVGIKYNGEGTQAGFWLRGQVLDGSGKLVPYDFTLEPKNPDVVSGNVQPGISWEGWKYVEADLSKIQPPYKINPGMTFRIMFVHGTKMGTRTANSLYFDNLQFVYGTNVDDVDDPIITSLTINGKKLEDDAVVKDENITIEAVFDDVKNKYTSGVDDDTVRMYVDGENVVNNKDKYNYGYDAAGNRAQLSDLKLTPGQHSLTVAVRDKFGNETTATKYFIVESDKPNENTRVSVIPKESKAVLGREVNLEIKATDNTVKESTTEIKLGNLFNEYEVVFSKDFDGEFSYSKLNKSIKIKATRKEASIKEQENIIATLKVKIPTTLKADNKFTYTVRNGKFTTLTDYYDTYSTKEKSLDIAATYNIKVDSIIVGGKLGVINVETSEGKPATNVSVYYQAEQDELIGETDENGQIITDKFNNTAGEYKIYAKDKEGGLSFIYKLKVYDAQGDKDGKVESVRFNVTEDATTQKNITWISNPLNDRQQKINYRPVGSDKWISVNAKTQIKEFTTNGHKIANINAVKLTGLTPDTTYEYQLGAEGAYSNISKFTTDKAVRADSKFFIIGDIQDPNKDNLAKIVDVLKQNKYNFGVQIGDAVDSASDFSDWRELGELLGAKHLGSVDMINVMGNHEYYGNADADIAAAMYNNPNTREGGYYSVEYGNIYIATINFATTKGQVQEAVDWLVRDAEKSNATWKILCTHQPPYYTNSTGGNEVINELLPNAVEKANIDVVFSGHDHSAARTNPLKGGKVDNEDGIVYYLCGAAGSKRYPITTDKIFDLETIFKFKDVDYGATYLTVSSNKDDMTIEMYDVTTGAQLDSLTIQSACKKNGHKATYDPTTNKITCDICREEVASYTGVALDKEGNEYYFIGGNMQTGWVQVGEDANYYNDKGIKQQVTVKEDKKTTCTVRGYKLYECSTAKEGEKEYKVQYTKGPGHVYDKNRVCTVCGWKEISLRDCNISLVNPGRRTYNGKEMKPYVNVEYKGQVFPEYYDYKRSFKNNVEIGTGTVTVRPVTRFTGAYGVDKGCFKPGQRVSINFDITPARPSGFVASNVKPTSATLKWKKVNEATGYDLYVRNIETNEFDFYKTLVGADTTTCELTDLEINRSYDFKIVTYTNAEDKSDEKNIKMRRYESAGTRVIFNTNDKIGKGVEATSISLHKHLRNTSLEMSWNKSSKSKLDYYEIYRSTTGKFDDKPYMVTDSEMTTKIIEDDELEEGKTYYYRIRGVKTSYGKKYYTKWSNVESEYFIRYKNSINGVKTTTLDLSKKVGNTSIELNWKKSPGYKIAYYEIYRSTTGMFNHKPYKVTKTEDTTSLVESESLENNKTYYYKVRGVRIIDGKKYYTKWSNVENENFVRYKNSINGVKKTTIELSSKVTSTSIELNWKKSPGYKIAYYEIYRTTTDKFDENLYSRTKSGKTTRIVNRKDLEDYKTYSYKVRGVRIIDGKKYYTKWSNVESRYFIKYRNSINGVKATTIDLETKNKGEYIELSWKKLPGYKLAYYEIYRSTTEKFNDKPYSVTKSEETTKVINRKDLKKGKTYYYKVRGVRILDGKKYYTKWSNVEKEVFK